MNDDDAATAAKTKTATTKGIKTTMAAVKSSSSHLKSLESLLGMIQERNSRETFPFIEIHDRCNFLEHQIEDGQKLFQNLERRYNSDINNNIRINVSDHKAIGPAGSSISSPSVGESAALRNERKMREQIERLEKEVETLKAQHEEDVGKIQRATKELKDLKEVHMAQEKSLLDVQEELDRKQNALDYVTTKVEDSQQRTKLAEQQYVGLKETIRILQEENDQYQKDNRHLEQRLVSEKERLSNELNSLTDTVEQLKRELDILRNNPQISSTSVGLGTGNGTTTTTSSSSSPASWFGFSSKKTTTPAVVTQDSMAARPVISSSSTMAGSPTKKEGVDIKKITEERRKFGSFSVIVPTEPKQIITAHHGEALCVSYDDSEAELVATGGADATVNVWNTTDGSLFASLKAGGSNAIISCDLGIGLVACGGSDRSCRIYNIKTKRLVHQLVGHLHKITSVRFFDGEKGIITSSADRRLKVWDISKQTYRQLNSIHLNSTANSIDVAFDSSTVVSGHADGGLRLWDIQTGQKKLEIEALHHGAITCVQFNPLQLSKVVTNGMDSKILVVDLGSGNILKQFQHSQFQTSYNWSSCCFSPDGLYVASGSSSNGHLFVWEVESGKLVKQLTTGHDVGVCGCAWGCNGSSGQQVASVDKSGRLVLWA